MNASLWQLAGWTMIHSLWLGAAVALAGGFLRLACRRASPNARYAISLATLALLAATPIAAAAWLSFNGVPVIESILPPPPGGEGWGEGRPGYTTSHPSLTLPIEGRESEGLIETPLPPQVIDLAQATPTQLEALATQAQPAAPPIPHSPLPIPPSDHQSPITSHLSTLIPYLSTLWLIGAPLTFTLLATGLVGSERLRRRATPLTAGPAFDACQRLRQTLSITRRVALAVCDDVAQPILVGIVRPLILLPTAALAGWTPEQLDMVLLHELAHVRRWDNLVNLLQRIVESLLFFHPAVWLVSRQVRRDREECCDAAVIRHTDRPEAYATLLIDIASRLRLSGSLSPTQSLTVASAMASHPLAGRIRRILNIEAEPMRITRRTLAATLLLPLLLAGAIFYSGASAEDAPSVKEQSSEVDAGDAADSTSLNNAEEPNEASARAKLIDDKLEEGAASVRTVYPIPPGTLVDPIELAKAIQSRHPVEIAWAEHQQGIIVSAPQDVHERVAALIKKSAAKTAKFTDDTFKPVMAHNLVDVDNAPLVGGYGILEEFAADADPSKIDAAIERLKAEKRSFSVEQSDNGSKRIVDQTPPAKKPTAKKPPTLEDNSSSYKQIRDLFTATDANPAVTVKYRAPPGVRKYVEDMFDGMEHDPYGPQISFHRVWSDDERTVEITAPTFAQGLYLDTVFNALSLESNVRQRESAQKSELSADGAQHEISQLQNEIRKFEDLTAKAQQELVDLEAFKELSAQSGPGRSSGLEEAIAEDLAQDPTIKTYKSQLVELNATLQTKLTESKSPNTPEIKRLRAVIQQAEAEMAKYQGEVSRTLREKYAHLPKNAKLAVEREYKIRRLGVEVELAEYQQQLLHYKQKLAEANAQLDVPQAIGTYATPTIAAADAIQRQIKNENPTANASPNVGATAPQSHTILAETKERLRRQLADLKARAAETKGTEAELAAVSALQAKILEWQVIDDARAASRYKRAATTGGNANDAGGPGSPNQGGAAAGSNANDAQPTATTSPDAVPLAQKPETPANDSANAPVDSANAAEQEAEKLRRLFQESASNEQITKFYTVPQGSRQELETAIGVAAGKLFGANKPPFQLKWEPDEDAVYVTAPQLAHRGYFHVAFAAHKLSKFDHPPDAELPEYQAALAELEKANADAALAMEGLPPAHLPPAPFPTLENQKIADRAYKLLGLELEPLTPAELERVKKLGYAGGLRVVAIDPNKQETLVKDNILVGLHVWPITDLHSLDAVLTREDLADLSPLRFRTVVKASDSPLKQPEDRIISGRMPIDVEAFRSIQRSLPSGQASAAKAPPTEAKPASDFDAITVIQAPISQKTSIFGGTVTTAYLKVKFDRLPYSVDVPSGRLTPQEIERNSMNCLALIRSPNVLKAALKSFTPQAAQDMWQDQAVVWLLDRLSVTFPGDGEIMELKLEGGDAKEDAVLLQAVIDAFLAAMKAPPESPADPNAAVPPGDLNRYVGRDVTPAPAIADYQHPALFAKALERSRKSSKPVIVHLLALNSDPSEQFANNILADPQVADFIHKNFDAITIYPEYHPAFAKKFRINRVPADMFIFAGGERIAGGVTPPATPELYLAHLKTHHKLATSTAIQNGDAPLVPEAAIAPAANRPANDQKPAATVDAGDAVSLKVAGAFPEAPLDGVFTIEPAGTLPLGPLYGRVVVAGKTVHEAEAAVKEHLSKTLTDVAVQLTLAPNPATTASDVAANRNSAVAPAEVNGLRFFKVFPPSADPKEISTVAERLRAEGKEVQISRDPAGNILLTGGQHVDPSLVDDANSTPNPTFLYDGKTFDQWRDLWKLELNPERRSEAISAMAAFSRAGRGDEALNAILDVAAEYDFSTIDPNDPEGRLKERIIKLFTDYASSGAYQDPWLPIVLERMQSDADKWRPLVEMLLYRCMPPHRTQYPGTPPIMSAASVELLKKAVGDDRLNAKVLFLTILNNVAAHDPDVVRMTKETLQSDDTESSLKLLGGIGFANVDELPEQLEFLFAAEPATRQTAREILSRSVGPQGRDAVADKLLAILNDPNQSARHADAIRALAMFSKTRGPTPYGHGLSKEKKREVFESLRRVAQTGSTELFVPAVVASELMYDAPELARSLLMKTLSDERKELLEESTQQLADEKELLFKGTALGEQPGGGFF